MGQLDQKIAIITGAGSGFGKGMAEAYVAEGANVVLADINGEGVEAVAASLGEQAVACRSDVSNGVEIQKLIDFCVQTYGEPDIVINNAGVPQQNEPLEAMDEATF